MSPTINMIVSLKQKLEDYNFQIKFYIDLQIRKLSPEFV